MTTHERRRNQYAGNCYVCGRDLAAGAGWLYSDTKSQSSRSRRRSSGRWAKQIKCDRCHQLKAASRADLPENRKPPTPRIGVNEVRKGRLESGTFTYAVYGGRHTIDCVFWVLPDGRKEVVAQPAPITSEPMAVEANYYNDRLWFGCELTPGATKFLDGVANEAVEKFRHFLETGEPEAVDPADCREVCGGCYEAPEDCVCD